MYSVKVVSVVSELTDEESVKGIKVEKEDVEWTSSVGTVELVWVVLSVSVVTTGVDC